MFSGVECVAQVHYNGVAMPKKVVLDVQVLAVAIVFCLQMQREVTTMLTLSMNSMLGVCLLVSMAKLKSFVMMGSEDW